MITSGKKVKNIISPSNFNIDVRGGKLVDLYSTYPPEILWSNIHSGHKMCCILCTFCISCRSLDLHYLHITLLHYTLLAVVVHLDHIDNMELLDHIDHIDHIRDLTEGKADLAF